MVMERLGQREPDSDPVVHRLLEESRARQSAGLHGRERITVVLTAAAFLGAAIPFAILVPHDRAFDGGTALALVALYVLATRIEFRTGSGWTDPSQLVFVPMLFLLPVPLVPLLAAAAILIAKFPDFLSGRIRADRGLVMVATSWYAFGPAAVFAIAGVGDPSWGDWPIYLAALGAQFGFDLASSVVTECIGTGLPVREDVRENAGIYWIDALLSPIGLLAAFAAQEEPWAFALILPLLALLAVFGREREARLENALALSNAYRGTAYLLAEFLRESHEYTGGHSRSVVVLSHRVAMKLGLGEEAMQSVEFGALLHDVGKMAIPNELLDKPGKLSDEEWIEMKRHTVEGEQMLERIGGALADVGAIVRSHHERFDGSGYPDGLRGEEIPIAARVISACDAFNAMTTDRSYREALSFEAAIAELRAHAGKQFDPDVVEALIEVVSPGTQPDSPPDRDAALLTE